MLEKVLIVIVAVVVIGAGVAVWWLEMGSHIKSA